jgi:capsular polysaccharide biosynthesis protein
LRKQEEARISDELDRNRIVNVAIAEAATVPAFPSSPRWTLNLVLGFAVAFVTSLGLAFVVDYMDPSFRTPDEVEGYLGLPVLAATPRAQ